jgi:hypothetical protein
MKKIAIVLPHLSLSQLAFCAIQNVNRLLKNGRYDLDIVLFYENLYQPCVNPLCGTMCISDLRNFDGEIISTTLDTTARVSQTVGQFKRHIFYVWDIEWYRYNTKNYLLNLQSYRDPNIEIVLRHENYKKPFEDYAGREVNKFVDDFYLPDIIGEIT